MKRFANSTIILGVAVAVLNGQLARAQDDPMIRAAAAASGCLVVPQDFYGTPANPTEAARMNIVWQGMLERFPTLKASVQTMQKAHSGAASGKQRPKLRLEDVLAESFEPRESKDYISKLFIAQSGANRASQLYRDYRKALLKVHGDRTDLTDLQNVLAEANDKQAANQLIVKIRTEIDSDIADLCATRKELVDEATEAVANKLDTLMKSEDKLDFSVLINKSTEE